MYRRGVLDERVGWLGQMKGQFTYLNSGFEGEKKDARTKQHKNIFNSRQRLALVVVWKKDFALFNTNEFNRMILASAEL